MKSHSPEGKTWRGRIANVYQEQKASNLTTAAAASDTTLYLRDASWASEDGGQVTLHDGLEVETVAYTGVRYDDNALTGVDVRTASFGSPETLVRAFPFETSTYASVIPDGVDSDVAARIPFSFLGAITTGARDTKNNGRAEGVLIQHDGDEWVVIDVLGTLPETGSHVFKHSMRFTDANKTDESVKLIGHRGKAFRAWATLEDKRTTPTVVHVKVDGTVVASCTIPAGQTRSPRVEIAGVDFQENQPISVEVQA